MKIKSILTPMSDPAAIDDIQLSASGKVAFWKMILPRKSVEYTAKDGTRQTLDFDEAYLTDLAKNAAVDSCGFLLADKENGHTMDPERWRGDVAKFEVRPDGLYGKVVFPNADAAKAVLDNPKLGVSARIREGVQKSDGTVIPRGIIHVLGTLDPQISGMSDWETADLSKSGEVLDLTEEHYKEPDMATKTTKTEAKSLRDFTEADIDAMTDDELDEFLSEFVPEFSDIVDEDDDDDDDEVVDETKDERELVGAGADMSKVAEDIELANGRAAYATSRAEDALSRLAESEWKSTSAEYLAAGVPPHLLDLAKPILARADEMVIDLSNTGEKDINVASIVIGLLDAAKGTIDMSNEAGHTGTFAEGEDPDAEILANWDN